MPHGPGRITNEKTAHGVSRINKHSIIMHSVNMARNATLLLSIHNKNCLHFSIFFKIHHFVILIMERPGFAYSHLGDQLFNPFFWLLNFFKVSLVAFHHFY